MALLSLGALLLNLQPVQNQEVMETSPASEMRRLRGDLLKEYDTTERPTKDPKQPVHVQLFFRPQHIVNLDEKYQILTIKGELMMKWVDEHLKWDPAAYSGISSFRIKSQEIWIPSIYSLYNVKRGGVTTGRDDGGRAASVHNDGSVQWRPEAVFDVPCSTRLRHYPFDAHNCSVLLFAFTSKNKITLDVLSHTEPSPSQVAGTAWTLTRTEHESIGPDMYGSPVVKVNLFLERTSRIYRHVCVAPSIVTLLTSLLGFWLLPSDSSRYMVGCSNVILMSLSLQNLAATVPAGKDIPLIASYNATFLCMSGAFLLVTVIAGLLRESSGRPPQAILRFFRRHLERHLCVDFVFAQPSDRILQEVNSGSTDGASIVSLEEEKRRRDWEYTSLVVDRISFYVFVLTYGILLGVLASV